MGDLTEGVPLLRIHSQCFTGEVLGSLRCDCRDQLEMAMQAIAEEGRGLVIYEYQEGRGIGLMAKLEAYELQDAGLDTVEANHALGFKADCRDFSLPAAIVRDLGIKRVRLLSNNPRKAQRIERKTASRWSSVLSCEAAPNPHSFAYLRTKKEKMGHALSLGMAKARTEQEICVRCDLVGWRTGMSGLEGLDHNRVVDLSSRARGIEAQLGFHQADKGNRRWMRSLPNVPEASFALN